MNPYIFMTDEIKPIAIILILVKQYQNCGPNVSEFISSKHTIKLYPPLLKLQITMGFALPTEVGAQMSVSLLCGRPKSQCEFSMFLHHCPCNHENMVVELPLPWLPSEKPPRKTTVVIYPKQFSVTTA